jgi:hypothetical protein
LDAFLKRVALLLKIPEQEQQAEIQDWKSKLGKYCVTVSLLQELADGSQWTGLNLDAMVKTKIQSLLPKSTQSGILSYPILSYPLLSYPILSYPLLKLIGPKRDADSPLSAPHSKNIKLDVGMMVFIFIFRLIVS